MLGARLVPPIVPTKLPALEPLRVDTPARPDGAGVVLVINPASGRGTGARVIDEVRRELPSAEIVELGAGEDLAEALRSAADRAEVLAVGGGDGTVSCAAAIAVQAGRPLAVFPSGTFNHFAKDIGCDRVANTVKAIRHGSVACVDLVCLNEDQMVINTASIGAYPTFVQNRQSSNTRSASRWRASTRCSTRCAATNLCASGTTTRPCRPRCSSSAIRRTCHPGSPLRGEPGWTMA